MLQIIYEDENLIALNKPAGILVHRTKKSSPNEETLIDLVLKKYPEIKNVGDEPKIRPGIVHRLDKDTSGILIIARNQKAFNYLKNLFQNHQIKKTYLALVYGKMPKRGLFSQPIGLKSGSIKRAVFGKKLKMLKPAFTEYQTLKIFEKDGQFFSLVQLMPKTGRTHQLRIHLAANGYPIVGDKLYSQKTNPWNLNRPFLCATSIEFSLPPKNFQKETASRRLKLEVELPLELKKILNELKIKS